MNFNSSIYLMKSEHELRCNKTICSGQWGISAFHSLLHIVDPCITKIYHLDTRHKFLKNHRQMIVSVWAPSAWTGDSREAARMAYLKTANRRQNLLTVSIIQEWKWFLYREFSVCIGKWDDVSKTQCSNFLPQRKDIVFWGWNKYDKGIFP